MGKGKMIMLILFAFLLSSTAKEANKNRYGFKEYKACFEKCVVLEVQNESAEYEVAEVNFYKIVIFCREKCLPKTI